MIIYTNNFAFTITEFDVHIVRKCNFKYIATINIDVVKELYEDLHTLLKSLYKVELTDEVLQYFKDTLRKADLKIDWGTDGD